MTGVNIKTLAQAIAIVMGAFAVLIGAAYLLSIYPIATYIPIVIAIGLLIAVVYQLIALVYHELEYNKEYKYKKFKG